MASENGSSDGTDTVWEGYADYKSVSRRVAHSVEDALDAYALLESAHQEGASVRPELAADCRKKIRSAAIRVFVELERDAEEKEEYQEIVDRWEGQDGFLAKMQNASLREGIPGWMWQFILDLRRGAWELGYLQAGRTVKADPEDPAEAEVQSMLRD